ncbi:hypothetical protein DFH07DRAFT_785351 [Mycena maculata]|uniref:RNase H type-1 domain-containing protein n=1 Tax=Mycena maculata TaxID=230809 RepID=A0AAD7HC07_9AGAR|nr:hypothetical protein DFH07DRAFT_785351 [Mycena maculata]
MACHFVYFHGYSTKDASTAKRQASVFNVATSAHDVSIALWETVTNIDTFSNLSKLLRPLMQRESQLLKFKNILAVALLVVALGVVYVEINGRMKYLKPEELETKKRTKGGPDTEAGDRRSTGIECSSPQNGRPEDLPCIEGTTDCGSLRGVEKSTVEADPGNAISSANGAQAAELTSKILQIHDAAFSLEQRDSIFTAGTLRKLQSSTVAIATWGAVPPRALVVHALVVPRVVREPLFLSRQVRSVDILAKERERHALGPDDRDEEDEGRDDANEDAPHFGVVGDDHAVDCRLEGTLVETSKMVVDTVTRQGGMTHNKDAAAPTSTHDQGPDSSREAAERGGSGAGGEAGELGEVGRRRGCEGTGVAGDLWSAGAGVRGHAARVCAAATPEHVRAADDVRGVGVVGPEDAEGSGGEQAEGWTGGGEEAGKAVIRYASLPPTHPLHAEVSKAERWGPVLKHPTLHFLMTKYKDVRQKKVEEVMAMRRRAGWWRWWMWAWPRRREAKEEALAEQSRKVGAAAVMMVNGVVTRTAGVRLGSARRYPGVRGGRGWRDPGDGVVEAGNRGGDCGEDAFTAGQHLGSQDGGEREGGHGRTGHYLWDIFHRSLRLARAKHTEMRLQVKWTPGHVDIPGNEAADEAAKRAALEGTFGQGLTVLSNLPCTLTHHRLLKKVARKQFVRSPCYARSKDIDDTLPSPKYRQLILPLPHKHSSLLFQLCSRHAPLHKERIIPYVPVLRNARRDGRPLLAFLPAASRKAPQTSHLLSDQELLPPLFTFIQRSGRFRSVRTRPDLVEDTQKFRGGLSSYFTRQDIDGYIHSEYYIYHMP